LIDVDAKQIFPIKFDANISDDAVEFVDNLIIVDDCRQLTFINDLSFQGLSDLSRKIILLRLIFIDKYIGVRDTNIA
jgi:hypothetical protein